MTVLKVLLVEDHPDWQIILTNKIRSAFRKLGHLDGTIQLMQSFDEAYQALSETSYHLLVTDIGLGNTATAQQKLGTRLVELAHELGIPAIAVSGTLLLTTQHVRDLLIKHGASDFFAKSEFDSQQFIAKVQELLKIQESLPEPDPKRFLAEYTTTAYALVIGIAKYRSMRPLAKTTIDAEDLYKVFTERGYARLRMQLLLDDQATKLAINQQLDWLADAATADDTVVIFFSGHGAQLLGDAVSGEYLCPVDADIQQVQETCISDLEFTTALRSIRAGRIVVFLDACHSGGVGTPKDSQVQLKGGLSQAAYDHFQGKGRFIIASCKPDEVSWETPNLNNGLFTHHLLAGIRGQAARSDGTVWMNDLFSYVYRQVSQTQLQHPYQKSDAEDFVLVTTVSSDLENF